MMPDSKKESLMTMMGIDDVEIAKIKGFVEFGPDDAAMLKTLLPLVTQHADDFVQVFYSNIQRYPELMAIITRSGSSIEKLCGLQKRYLLSMFEGEYGPGYVEQRLKIGAIHTKIGLTPRWYLGSYSLYLRAFSPIITQYFRFNFKKRQQALAALYKIIAIDSELVIETYNRKLTDEQFLDYQGQLEAIDRSYGVIEFDLNGMITRVNPNFLTIVGYTEAELMGKHHRCLVDPEYANSQDYVQFWEKLRRGEFETGEFRRIGKGGGELWLQSNYSPIFDSNGQITKVVKYAMDITAQRHKELQYKERVDQFSEIMQQVAEGDLRGRVLAKGNDEVDFLGKNLNAMIDGLTTVSRQILASSNGLFSMLSDLQSAVVAQSSGATEQAAAVNETTVTLEEIKVSSTQTLDKAQQLIEIADRTRREGEQGLGTVAEAIAGMEAVREQMENIAKTILDLSEKTQQIGEITSVVTNLAQQSKMLALNASIEAAKAGEAGKGFAVVAGEVKELAEQSQQSTAQVQKILQDIRHATDRAVMATEEGRKGVDSGVQLVEKSGEVMKKLSEVIHEAGTANQQIVIAVRQEVTGIEQTNSAMSEINKVTANFVNNVVKTKVVAEDLTRVAETLKKIVSVYQLNEESDH